MKLSELHLLKYARVDGTMTSHFTAADGWDVEVRNDLGGVMLGRKNRDNPEKRDQLWVPFTNCLNGVPVEVPAKAGK